MQISVFGAGYLGAIHATCMAHLGHDVTAYDIDASKISMLADGKPPFYEPGFEELLATTLDSGKLRFTISAEEAVRGAQLHFICVGTPQLQSADGADMRYLDAAFDTIVEHADRPGLIVGKSTVPVGTAHRLSEVLLHRSSAAAIAVAWNPEFLREGTAIEDTLRPDRLVFGVESNASEALLKEVYSSLLHNGVPFITTDLATSEMVKVAANSFLATKISFINAMAEICEVANADVLTLSKALGYDERIGAKYLRAGLGFGGGCLPKDIRAFSARAGELGAADAVSFLREIDKINQRRRERLVSVVSGIVGGDFLGKKIAVLGASFKPNSDDVRDSPALNVAAAMHLRGASVRVHDPQAIENAKRLFPTLTYCSDIEEACRNAEVLVLATEWDEYQKINPAKFRDLVRKPVLVDARNAMNHEWWSQSGWQVHGLGRGHLNPGAPPINASPMRMHHDFALDTPRQAD